ncbi:hypothetical protein [Actinomadura sp. BRA 177]|uniref:hypothetical protein n=1 Tax=Actinomadura sp. BRA 177 TaxID=2745202 RepID=UPI001595D145|nr:hypothetical protein [Actinomadura sp. BRA 177]NVI89945.1 hypothetical protein [Actinomadura sp. BRA 177]
MRIAPNTGAQPARQSADTSVGALPMDTDQVRRDLEYLFPGVIAWFGRHTGHWWAMLGDRLLEADTSRQLADRIRATLAVLQSGVGRRTGLVTGPSGYVR